MFDELKDPRPPQVTEVHIISVIARAHRIRRRQRVAVLTASAAFAAGIGGIALMARDGGPSVGELALAPASGAPTPLPAPVLPITVQAVRTAAPAVVTVAPTATEPAPAVTEPPVAAGSEPSAPTTDVAAATTSSRALAGPTTTVTVDPVPEAPGRLAAVDANGDLVVIDTATGNPTVLVAHASSDGGSAAGVSPAVLIAGGTTPDGFAYYADQVTGTVRAASIDHPGTTLTWGQGTDPKLSPDGSMWVARTAAGDIEVHALSDAVEHLGLIPGSNVVDYAWFGNEAIALLGHGGPVWTVTTMDATLTSPLAASTIDGEYLTGAVDAVDVSFAGSSVDGLLVVAQRRNPADGVAPAQRTWIQPGSGAEQVWQLLASPCTAISLDPAGGWLARLTVDGSLVVEAPGGGQELPMSGVYSSIGW